MKRMIAFVLLLSLISACCFSLSESNDGSQRQELQYGDSGDDVKSLQMPSFSPVIDPAEKVSEGITFRGIPWYSTPEEVFQVLIDSGFVDARITSSKDWKSKLESLYDTSNASGKSEFYYDDNSEVGYSIFCTGISAPKEGKVPDRRVSTKLKKLWISKDFILKTIAKVNISRIELMFSIASGIPQLVEIDIRFLSGGSKTKDALVDALQSAYGQPVVCKKAQAGFGSYAWPGSNSTVVIHYYYYVSFSIMDGLILSDTVDVPEKKIPTPEPEPEPVREDTGF